MFFIRRRCFFNQYGAKAIYFDCKTHELLEAPKSKLLDTEKSSRMNRHIPLLVVLFLSSGGGLISFFRLFLHGTYTMTTFWSVILILDSRVCLYYYPRRTRLYRNVNRAEVTSQRFVG